MIFSATNNPAAKTTWYQNALVYVGLTVVVIAVFIALVAIETESGVPLLQRLWQAVGILVACGLVTGGYLTLVRGASSANGDGVVPATIVFDAVCFTVGGLVIVSFANPVDPRQWAGTIMWALACLAIGAITGFLFGIPRSRRESGPASSQPATKQAPVKTMPLNSGAPVPNQSTDKPTPPDPGGPGLNGGQTNDAAVPPVPTAAPPTGDSGSPGPPEQSSASPSDAKPSNFSDPSPIEQISDWLTKIIVGLGLANLKELPGQLDTWARYVAMSIGSSAVLQREPNPTARELRSR